MSSITENVIANTIASSVIVTIPTEEVDIPARTIQVTIPSQVVSFTLPVQPIHPPTQVITVSIPSESVNGSVSMDLPTLANALAPYFSTSTTTNNSVALAAYQEANAAIALAAAAYLKANTIISNSAPTTIVNDIFMVTAANTNTFKLSSNVANSWYVFVSRNGLTQYPGMDYTITSNNILNTSGCQLNDVIEARIFTV